MRPPGVVPASSVPSLRTASAVTHAASRSAILRAGFSSPACGALVSTAKILPWSPVPKYATCPSRLGTAHQTNAASSGTCVVFMPATTSPVGKIMLPVASPSSKSLAVV